MKKVLAVVLLVIAISSVFIAPAFAKTTHHVAAIHDTADGTIDNLGPVAGFCTYNQNGAGDLRLTFYITGGRPNTTYSIGLFNGPTWTTWTMAYAIGMLTTDAAGRGINPNIWIPVSTLQEPWLGSGPQSCMLVASNVYFGARDIFDAAPLNFTVP